MAIPIWRVRPSPSRIRFVGFVFVILALFHFLLPARIESRSSWTGPQVILFVKLLLYFTGRVNWIFRATHHSSSKKAKKRFPFQSMIRFYPMTSFKISAIVFFPPTKLKHTIMMPFPIWQPLRCSFKFTTDLNSSKVSWVGFSKILIAADSVLISY